MKLLQILITYQKKKFLIMKLKKLYKFVLVIL